jgi:hypothetical protein
MYVHTHICIAPESNAFQLLVIVAVASGAPQQLSSNFLGQLNNQAPKFLLCVQHFGQSSPDNSLNYF